jgi:hypothetical protein
VLKLIAFTFALTSAGGAQDPTPPTPPAGPTAPKDPEAPAARKSEKGEKPAAKPEAGKGEAPKAAAGKGEAPKGDAHKGEDHAGDGHEGHGEKPGKKGAGKPARSTGAPPPSLTGSALRQELKQNAGEEKGGAPLSERAKLEQMAAEIAKAREALRQDTARLEAMLRGGGDGRMPIGDPMNPVASPGGPAASKEAMKEQILTVSKAMKGMKPEQAAAIISRLDRVLASEILRRMKPADAGAVMASVKPELAAELATAIATRQSMVEESKAVKK